MAKFPRPSLKKLFVKQLCLAFGLALLLGIIWQEAWISVIAGVLVALIPQLIFSWFAFSYSGARQQFQQLKALFLGAALKFGSTVVLFVLVFTLVPLSNPILFLSTYALVVLLNWLNPWLVRSRTS